MPQAELENPRNQVIPVVEAGSEDQGNLEEVWDCDDRGADPYTSNHVVKILLEAGSLLTLGYADQGFTDGREQLVLGDLGIVQEVGQVCPHEI